MILDNADDATVLLELSTSDTGITATPVRHCLLDFLPRVQHGAVLITTRDRTCALDLNGHHGTPIEVRSMSLNESVQLLRRILPDAVEEEAAELVEELENVPLAISQASAYIKAVSQVSIHKYLATFRRSNEDQAALLNKDKGDLRRDRGVPNAVVTSWELSFNQIREKSPDAADLLSVMSYFSRQAIPQILIQGDVDEITFYDDINPLLSFSLIRAEIGGDAFEMHRLVQTAMRHWLQSKESDQLWKERAIERVAQQFPWRDQEQHWPLCEVLLSHADEVILHTAISRESQLHRADVLVKTAWYLVTRKGHAGLAEQRSTQALQIQQRYFENDSDKILATLGILAQALQGNFKREDAKSLEEDILNQRLEKWGPENVNTLTAMHNLALSYWELGQYEKAEDLLKRVIEGKESLFGPEDPETLVSTSPLASIQLDLGRYEEAEKLSYKTLEISTRCLGVEHVGTLNAMRNLSDAYFQQSKFEEAEKKIAQAIPLLTRVFGLGHWRTLDAKKSLARIYYRQDKLDEAEEICAQCLGTAQAVYGLQHDTASNSKSLLGLIYQRQGRFIDASRLLRDVMELSKEVLGADHPGTLTHMYNVAFCCYDMGDKDDAIQLMTEVLQKPREVLRSDHPAIARCAKRLAHWKSEVEATKEWETEEKRVEIEGNE